MLDAGKLAARVAVRREDLDGLHLPVRRSQDV
jgi:hypothetical protein